MQKGLAEGMFKNNQKFPKFSKFLKFSEGDKIWVIFGFKAKFRWDDAGRRRCHLHHMNEQVLSFPMVGGIL